MKSIGHKTNTYLQSLALFCLTIFFMIGNSQAFAQTGNENCPEREISNAEAGYNLHLQPGWDNLNPLLMQLYNLYAGNATKEGQEPIYLLGAYSKPGKQNLPPMLFVHFATQPITAELVDDYNRTFLAEAMDDEGKTKLANKLGLASSVAFENVQYLPSGAPVATILADTSFGFKAKAMSAPFYTKQGILSITFFAPQDEFALLEDEVLNIMRSVVINSDKIPQ